MTFKEKVCLLLTALMLAAGFYYHARYQAAQLRAERAERQLKAASAELAKAQKSQRDVAALDAAYTKELADAHNALEVLHRDVASGAKRLRLAATCKLPVPHSAASAGVDDATGPELTADARQAYFHLREQLTLTRTALTGLQAYVREQCLK